MVLNHIYLAGSWILYCVLHSVFASLRFKKMAMGWLGKNYQFYRFYYTLFALAGFVVIMMMLFTIPSYPLIEKSQAVTVTGMIVSAAGLLVMILCITKYFMQLSGLRSLIENRTGNELMITGIHKFVRHPLYAGTFVFIWGLLLLYPYLSLLIVDVIITVYTLIGLRYEEYKLEKEFGEKYSLYKKQVPMLIPKLVK